MREPGLYVIEYAGAAHASPSASPPTSTATTSGSPAWTPISRSRWTTSRCAKRYRVWHGASHLDDARQAPVDHKHFDGYAQGPSTDSPFEPGQHIPGLNQGGWYDAGDFDIRTESQDAAIIDLAWAIETFHLAWDETTIDEKARTVEIRRPDGIPDALQQVEHGVLQVLAQFKAVGHSIPGIIAPNLRQYTHLGDARLGDRRQDLLRGWAAASDGFHSAIPDDRWAFTTRTTPLQYASAAALAAASRVLRGDDDALAAECLDTAQRVWAEEHKGPPSLFRSFNTTGGGTRGTRRSRPRSSCCSRPTGDRSTARVSRSWRRTIRRRIGGWDGSQCGRCPSWMPTFRASLGAAVAEYKTRLDAELAQNPFGVPMPAGGWGGAGAVAGFASRHVLPARGVSPDRRARIHAARRVDYLLGTHPVSSVR